MPTYYNFTKDFSIAQKTEKEIAELLVKLYNATILNFGNSNEYDILAEIKGIQYKFEVKEDFTCEKTGNVGLEFEYRGKPSGIQTSKSNFYIYKIHTRDYGINIFLFRTTVLKQMILEKKYFRIVNGGDPGSNSMNYLFKYDTFIRNGKLMANTS